MASMTLSTIRARVKALIRENQESSALESYGDTATLSLNDLIDANVEPAAMAVYQIAPDSVWASKVETETVSGGKTSSTWVHIFSVTVGGVPAMVDINRRSTNYDVAADDLNGSLGVKARPYVLMEGSKVTSMPTGTIVINGVKQPKVSNSSIDIDTALSDAVCYWIAYLVLVSMGENNASAYREQSLLCMGASGTNNN